MAIVRIPVEIVIPGVPSACVNVWHARVETAGDLEGGGVEPFNGPLGALHTFYTAIKNLYPTAGTITIPEQVVEVSTQEIMGTSDPIPVIGTTGSFMTSPGLAITVGWQTSIAARRGRGRTFIGPLKAGAVQDDGTVHETDKATLTTALTNLLNESKALNGWALGVWGQESANNPTPKVLRDFQGFTVAQKFAHLRSRRD
jgi:hypothetical protein